MPIAAPAPSPTPPTVFRIDESIGAKNKMWGFWSSRENTDSGGNSNMPLPIQTCCGTVNQLRQARQGGLGLDYYARRLFNSLTVGGNRSNNINKSKASQMGTDWDQKLNIPNGFSNDFPVFQFYGNTFPQPGTAGRLDGHRQRCRAQRHSPLAARRAQLCAAAARVSITSIRG